MDALRVELSYLQDKYGDSSSDESCDETEQVEETQLRKDNEVEGLICLMADCDEITSNLSTTHTEHSDESSSSDSDNMSESSMLMGFMDVKKELIRLTDENQKLAKDNLDLAEKVRSLENLTVNMKNLEEANSLLKGHNSELVQEIESMNVVVTDLKSTAHRFSKASDILDVITNFQRSFGDMTGLGFTSTNDVGTKTNQVPQTTPDNGKGGGIIYVTSQEMQKLVDDSVKRRFTHGVGFSKKDKQSVDKSKVGLAARFAAESIPYANQSNKARMSTNRGKEPQQKQKQRVQGNSSESQKLNWVAKSSESSKTHLKKKSTEINSK